MSVSKGIQLKSDVKISESFENAPAQLLVVGPPSYLQCLGKIDVKRSHTLMGLAYTLKFHLGGYGMINLKKKGLMYT